MLREERLKAACTLAAALLALVLVALITAGVIDGNALTEAVAFVLAIGTTVLAWWRNNNVTEAAVDAQQVLDALKGKGAEDAD